MATRKKINLKKIKTDEETLDPKNFVNHVAFVVDSSASMEHLTRRTIEVFNNQLNAVRRNAVEKDQKTFISLFLFDTKLKELVFRADPSVIPMLSSSNYKADGRSTSLRDAVGEVIEQFATMKEAKDVNHSMLILTITDGQENSSKKFSEKALAKLIKDKQGTDRWSFVFMVPRGDAHYITDLGVPAGNVQEWETTEKGIKEVGDRMSCGLDSYYVSRSTGKKSTGTFFATAANITSQDVKNLRDESGDFFRWEVKNDCPINVFVEDKISRDRKVAVKLGGFRPGCGYYQLVKSEKVQASKDVLIMHKKTGAIYGGNPARSLVGIPQGQACQVRPGSSSDYHIFVLSTSNNRKLTSGSIFLYRI